MNTTKKRGRKTVLPWKILTKSNWTSNSDSEIAHALTQHTKTIVSQVTVHNYRRKLGKDYAHTYTSEKRPMASFEKAMDLAGVITVKVEKAASRKTAKKAK